MGDFVRSAKNWDGSDDQILLVNSLVMACHHNCSSVCVKMFLEFQLALFDCMLQLIRMFIEQCVNSQARMVGFLACCLQQILLIWQRCIKAVAVAAFYFCPSRKSCGWDLKKHL